MVDRLALPSEIVAQFTRTAPVNLDGLATALGLEVRYERMGDVAGKIERTSPERFRITINGMDNPRRQRFTLAHEIGHYVLHRSMIGSSLTDDAMYRSSLSDMYERQANRYAAELIMPPSLVRSEWARGAQSVGAISSRFDVSQAAAGIRLAELGLDGPPADLWE